MKTPSQTHIPVMLNEILSAFEPLKNRGEVRYFDGTLGRAGHLSAIIEVFSKIEAVAMDRDPQALSDVSERLKGQIESGKLKLIKGNFNDFSTEKLGEFDLMLIDLGVSSPQLDNPERGFSFYHEGPLDMRMDPTEGATAADLVNSLDEQELIEIFRELGEVHRPFRVAREIVHQRKTQPFETTLQLAKLIESTDGWRKKGVHPATNYFLALRLQVNQELSLLDEGLNKLKSGLKPGGRLAVLTFHSLEDRIVKNNFRNSGDVGKPVNKKVIVPERPEILGNPRSRSAKLRIFEKAEQIIPTEHSNFSE